MRATTSGAISSPESRAPPDQRHQDEVGAVVAVLDRRQHVLDHARRYRAGAAGGEPRQRAHRVGLGVLGNLVQRLGDAGGEVAGALPCRAAWQISTPSERDAMKPPTVERDVGSGGNRPAALPYRPIASRRAPASRRSRQAEPFRDMKSPAIVDRRPRPRPAAAQPVTSATSPRRVGRLLEMHVVERRLDRGCDRPRPATGSACTTSGPSR